MHTARGRPPWWADLRMINTNQLIIIMVIVIVNIMVMLIITMTNTITIINIIITRKTSVVGRFADPAKPPSVQAHALVLYHMLSYHII